MFLGINAAETSHKTYNIIVKLDVHGSPFDLSPQFGVFRPPNWFLKSDLLIAGGAL